MSAPGAAAASNGESHAAAARDKNMERLTVSYQVRDMSGILDQFTLEMRHAMPGYII